MANPIVSLLTKALFKAIEKTVDNNWDSILDHVAQICCEKGLDPDDQSDSALRTIADSFGDYVRETNFFDKWGLSEDEAYFHVLKWGEVNWAQRVQKRVRKLQEAGN